MASAKLFGVTFCSNLMNMLKHFDYLFTTFLLVEMFKKQGVPAKQLNVVFCAIIMSRVLYALPAWGGFLTNELIAKFDVFLKKNYVLWL